MRARTLLAEGRTPGGERITLSTAGGHFLVSVGGTPMMSSEAHHSEERIAEIGCAGLRGRAGARVLVGGLGMGYTLRAALDALAPTARVVVVELVPDVVAWNRGPLASLAGSPLEDPRVELVVRDVVAYVRSGPTPFDAILLDVDNGPDAVAAPGNVRLYGPRGLRGLCHALRPGGTLVVWSAYESPAFPSALAAAGLLPEVVKVKSRGRKGSRHTIYVGRRPASGPAARGAGPGTPGLTRGGHRGRAAGRSDGSR